MVQARLDSLYTGACRAQHLRAVFKHRLVASVLAVAPGRRGGLAGRTRGGPDRALRDLCFRVGAGAGQHIPDKPLRSIRAQAGLPVSAGQKVHAVEVWYAGSVQAREASAVPGMADGILGYARDDGGAPGLCGSDDGVHTDGDTVRREGPGGPSRGGVQEVSEAGADDTAGAVGQSKDRGAAC